LSTGARSALRLAVLLASVALGGLLACETVDLGTPPADVNACRPSQAYFVTEIWPNVLAKDYGGRHCYDSRCHDPASGRPLSLIANPMPVLDPAGVIPNPLPDDWAKNYRSTTEQMNCANVAASDLILLPTNTRTHGGGQLFAPGSMEVTSLTMWVSQP
jgi:hypothetical protein